MNVLVAPGRRDLAVFVLIMLSTYLRPGQLLSTQGSGLAPPTPGATPRRSLPAHPEERPGRGKIGDADVSTVMDSSWAEWTGPALAWLKESAGDGPLWKFDYGEPLKAFR